MWVKADQDVAAGAQPVHFPGLGQRLAEHQPLDLVGMGGRQAVAGLDLDQPENGDLDPAPGLQQHRGPQQRQDARRRLDIGRDHGEAGAGGEALQVLQAGIELVVAGAQQVQAQAVEQLEHGLAGRVVLVDDRVAGEVVAGAEIIDVCARFSSPPR